MRSRIDSSRACFAASSDSGVEPRLHSEAVRESAALSWPGTGAESSASHALARERTLPLELATGVPSMQLPRRVAIVLLVSVVGCSQQPVLQAVEQPIVPTTEAECLARGGSWMTLGLPMQGKPKVCDLRATDAGKACTDSRQCQGACIAPGAAAAGAAVIGACSEYVKSFGNLSLVNNGIVEQLNAE